MRYFLTSMFLVLVANSAMAQSYPSSEQHQQMQVSGNYANQYYYQPQQPSAAPAPQPVQQPQTQHYQQPQPGDYGRSVMSDIRQMNF